jgi:nitrile hydratase accessory protein
MADPTLDLDGPAPIPRRNGEPRFDAPWQGRAFGMAIALCERGAFEWEEFRSRLIAEIAAAEAEADDSSSEHDEDGSLYYERWTAALTGLLAERGLVPERELGTRAEDFRTGARREVY